MAKLKVPVAKVWPESSPLGAYLSSSYSLSVWKYSFYSVVGIGGSWFVYQISRLLTQLI